jgi:zinc transporter ZupT
MLHYLIALFWTTLFYLASLKLTIARRHVVLSGLLYGLVIYLAMNLVVLPNSRVPHSHPISTASIVNGVLALMLCIGLPVSIVISRYLTRESRERVVM